VRRIKPSGSWIDSPKIRVLEISSPGWNTKKKKSPRLAQKHLKNGKARAKNLRKNENGPAVAIVSSERIIEPPRVVGIYLLF